jgi:hypothetical protein
MSNEFPAVLLDRARYLVQRVIEDESGNRLALYRALLLILTDDLQKKGAAFSTRLNLGALGESTKLSISFTAREHGHSEHLVKFATTMREARFYGDIFDTSDVVYNLKGQLEPVHATFSFHSFGEMDGSQDARQLNDISEFAFLLASIILQGKDHGMRTEISRRVREAKTQGHFQYVQCPNLPHQGKESFSTIATNELVIPFLYFLEAVQSNGQHDLNL